MELDNFISETLRQILAGVTAAQAHDHGSNINAASVNTHGSGHLINDGSYGVFTRVDFDVAVTAETSGAGKASIRVWAIGVEGGGEKRSQTASRVSFSVPIRLPDGDQSKEEEYRRRRARAQSDRGTTWGG